MCFHRHFWSQRTAYPVEKSIIVLSRKVLKAATCELIEPRVLVFVTCGQRNGFSGWHRSTIGTQSTCRHRLTPVCQPEFNEQIMIQKIGRVRHMAQRGIDRLTDTGSRRLWAEIHELVMIIMRRINTIKSSPFLKTRTRIIMN